MKQILTTGLGLALFLGHAAHAVEPTPTVGSSENPPPLTTNVGTATAQRLIVKYVDTATERSFTQEALNGEAERLGAAVGTALRSVRAMSGNAQVIEIVDDGRELSPEAARDTLAEIAARIAEDPAVEYAVPDEIVVIQQSNDPEISNQWHYTAPGTGINLPPAWTLADGGNVVVAVLDSGHRPHADLAANLVPGYDFVSDLSQANDGNGRDADARDPGDWCPPNRPNSSWHGTHVAGTVAALTNNGIGVAGVAPKTKIQSVRVLGKCGGSFSDIIDGIRWSVGLPVPGAPANTNPAKVLNLSLGTRNPSPCTVPIRNALNDAIAAGATVVVAAGNSNGNAGDYAPGNCPNVITVASTKRDGGRAYYSNSGGSVEIAAPGGETVGTPTNGVLSTFNTGNTVPGADSYHYYQGTSMAAPHVAGIAALMLSANPSLTNADVVQALRATANPFPAVPTRPCSTAICGAGIANAAAAIEYVMPNQSSADLSWIPLLLK